VNDKNITFNIFENEIKNLIGLSLCHMDPYYQKIDLHFGRYRKNKDGLESGDFILYISGFWEVLNSGLVVLSENNSQEEIIEFFTKLVGEAITSVMFFKDSSEVFLKLTNGYYFHFMKQDSRWIELLKRNGELFYSKNGEQYLHRNPK